MATKLTLVETFKTDCRKNGDISYIKAQVILDGIPVEASFRCRMGEEAIIVDGDTITVSDAQVDSLRKVQASNAAHRAEYRAEQQAAFDRVIDDMNAKLDAMGASDEARAEISAHYHAAPALSVEAHDGNSVASGAFRFRGIRRDILTRHGLS